MKNIHVLPTEKPSRLSIIDSQLIYSKEYFINPQHIYITSDEEIKDEDWCVCEYSDGDVSVNTYKDSSGFNKYKIILTTDQDLIKEGVQAIDDEFLEWFVKNPSCESVEVEKGCVLYDFKYEIIIPQENPKQETLEELKKWKEEALIAHEINQKFIEKLMAERKQKYTELDMMNYALYILRNDIITPKEWFEQFKNK